MIRNPKVDHFLNGNGQAVRLQLPEPEFTRFWQAGRESLDEVLNFIAGWEENAPVSPDLFSSKGRS